MSSRLVSVIRPACRMRRDTLLPKSRGFCLTGVRRDTFNVQDEDDFTAKVLESKEPVIVSSVHNSLKEIAT